jgi:FkbM family methyltransferase
VSFEPVSFTFAQLSKNSAKDSNWEIENYALGEFEASADINLSDNSSMSASIKDPLMHTEIYPSVKFENSETIQVIRLDESRVKDELGPLLLKLDVQGFEHEALKGASALLDKVALIEIETSFREMYAGELKHTELITYLESKGFTIYTIAPPAIDKLGRIGYLDCLLLNTEFERNLK